MIILEPGLDSVGYFVKVKYKKFSHSSYMHSLFWMDCRGCQLAVPDGDGVSDIDTSNNNRLKIIGVDLF